MCVKCIVAHLTNIIAILQENQETQTLAISLHGGDGQNAVNLVEEVFDPGEESVHHYYQEVMSTVN